MTNPYGQGWSCWQCNGWVTPGITHVCFGRTPFPPTFTPLTAVQGWECPRCRTIHAPFVVKCECAPTTEPSEASEVPNKDCRVCFGNADICDCYPAAAPSSTEPRK